MKIKMKILALMMIVVMALTGCVGMETKVIIRQDGSAKGIITVSIDKTAVNAELKKQGASDAEIQQFWTGYKQDVYKRLVHTTGPDGDKVSQWLDVICVNRYYAWYNDHGHLDVIGLQLEHEMKKWYNKYHEVLY